MDNDLLKDLNEEQKKAVTFGDGPLLIVAGAGTGKTTVITKRLAWLVASGKAKTEQISIRQYAQLLPSVYTNPCPPL